jgi:hypothetical protein
MKASLKSLLILALLTSGLTVFASPRAYAQFEVKEVTVEKGEVEFEYNADYHTGNPSRKFALDSGEIIADENDVLRQRHAIELGFGFTDRLKVSVGTEFEEERFDDVDNVSLVNAFGSLKASSIEAEGTYVLLPMDGNSFGLAAYTGIEHALESGEGNIARVGALMSLRQGSLSASANFIFAKNFSGSDPEENSDDRWDFEYATQIAYEMSGRLTLAVEAFGTVKRIGSSGSPGDGALAFGDQDQHRIGPVVYYTLTREAHQRSAMKLGKDDDDGKEDEGDDEGGVTLGAGVLFGLNNDTADATLKWSLAAEF